jgi:hypothetical protein
MNDKNYKAPHILMCSHAIHLKTLKETTKTGNRKVGLWAGNKMTQDLPNGSVNLLTPIFGDADCKPLYRSLSYCIALVAQHSARFFVKKPYTFLRCCYFSTQMISFFLFPLCVFMCFLCVVSSRD